MTGGNLGMNERGLTRVRRISTCHWNYEEHKARNLKSVLEILRLHLKEQHTEINNHRDR
jgi:hypothetical protein